MRILRFRSQQTLENALKQLWYAQQRGKKVFNKREICTLLSLSSLSKFPLLAILRVKKWVCKSKGSYSLTEKGGRKGARVVRLHRLWEAYLVRSLGVHEACVHKSAEEMEHILTPELEKELTKLLDDPKQDPHNQPIPSQEVVSHG